jgi:glycosyltransferase involved in cell wall biosynthesis
MGNARVDIVIPVYNGAPFIAECLDSVLRQSYANWTATVIDNCSTDGTGTIADSFALRDPRVRVVHCTEFVDQCGNYNRALSHASADAVYIKILEADNWITDDALTRTVELAEQNPDVGIVGSFWLRGPYVYGCGIEPDRAVLTNREAFQPLFEKWIYLFGTPTTLLFRAKAVREQSVWFRPGMFYDDLELCVRILKTWKFGYLYRVLAYVRDDNEGMFSEVRRLDYQSAFRYFLLRDHRESWFDEPARSRIFSYCRRRYFTQLGWAMLTLRGEDYWAFHRKLFAANAAVLKKRDTIIPLLDSASRACMRPILRLARVLRLAPAAKA